MIIVSKFLQNVKILRFLLNRHNDYWIGLFHSNIPNKVYKWSNCMSLSNSLNSWKNKEPSSTDRNHCIKATEDDGRWKTELCHQKLPFICEKSLG